MDEDWKQTALPGVLRRKLTPHEDGRGVVREAWRASWTEPLGTSPRQINHSQTRAGALRGVHFHLYQTDLWIMLGGSAVVGLADIRALLAGEEGDAPATVSLELAAGDCVLIPVGVAHGLWALTDVSLLYVVTAEYDGSDEHGFAWNDPTTRLPWPGVTPTLSARDSDALTLAQAVRRARPGG